MNPLILALSTAVPPHIYLQADVVKKAIAIFGLEKEKAELANRIYLNSAIEKRHSVFDDFHKPREEWEFLGSHYPEIIPGMSDRNIRYKKEAPKLAEQAARQALELWGGDPSRISHIISVSCTGVMAPGIEFHLMQSLGLSPSVNRLGINFMGCFGAFKGLSVARAFAQENPANRILLVCTELCTLHLQADHDSDTILGNSLFGDGSAAAIIGSNPNAQENPLLEICRFYSLGFKDTLDKMSWEASDKGLVMRLSHTVPVLIGRQIKEFKEGLLKDDVDSDLCDWAIHPGGKSILQAIEKRLNLDPDQTKASWKILNDYGNMSSASFLFVLDLLSRQIKRHEWTAGVGFGPGLSAEGILMRKSKC
jgi:predicted naringenin-chalcone synthase